MRINKVGIELEGCWHNPPARCHDDGSVNVECNCANQYGTNRELASLPLTVAGITRFVRTNYPDHVNGTCGMHVHMSFKSPADYARLTEEDFNAFFIEGLHDWGLRNNIRSK